MKSLKLTILIFVLASSLCAYSQSTPNLIIIRYATQEKGTMNMEKPYFYIINENSQLEQIDIDKEKLEEGQTTILIHKKLGEYYSKGYRLVSSNFSTTINGYLDKGEYILLKE